MKMYSKILLVTAFVLGTLFSATAIADSIHGTLKERQGDSKVTSDFVNQTKNSSTMDV